MPMGDQTPQHGRAFPTENRVCTWTYVDPGTGQAHTNTTAICVTHRENRGSGVQLSRRGTATTSGGNSCKRGERARSVGTCSPFHTKRVPHLTRTQRHTSTILCPALRIKNKNEASCKWQGWDLNPGEPDVGFPGLCAQLLRVPFTSSLRRYRKFLSCHLSILEQPHLHNVRT